MITVKPLKDLNSQPSPKKPYHYWDRLLPTVLLATLIGTYLDLYFVGKGLYSFPLRPFPSIFTINLLFTTIVLPIFIIVFILLSLRLQKWMKLMFILTLSTLMAAFEKFAESLGLFVHHAAWQHYYSFFGYSVYLSFILLFYHLLTIND
ncbi:CBO0543 family protein [Robertmurraya massiliosenegalensis]|uniref:CBO0543 family protein n=1 Tax=Robertmurraya massiliosenegalensis TaxID=1287657 RepID=UPI0006841171|nr:CBO0543 family protein [Robertmurraya massiliosenegalensis]